MHVRPPTTSVSVSRENARKTLVCETLSSHIYTRSRRHTSCFAYFDSANSYLVFFSGPRPQKMSLLAKNAM